MNGERAIFEEAATGEVDAPKPSGGLIDGAERGARAAIRFWLMGLLVLVFLTIVVGGLTRLMDSGLSIVEWEPVSGVVPPMSQEAWEEEFASYRKTPEFRLQNNRMTLAEFRTIYWWEWGHRQSGRAVGLVWAVGFLFFWLAGRIPVGWTGRLFALGPLIGLQGVIGWWMVRSGLTGQAVDVASYRLAIHLGLAFVVLGLVAWHVLRLARSEADLLRARRGRDAGLFSLATGLMHFAFLQLLLGALVAGIDAGRSYTDWPLMGGQAIPDGMLALSPVWLNFLENPATTQFVHRLTGYLLIALAFVVWRRSRTSGNTSVKAAFLAVFAMLVLQAILGVATVVHAAPWQIAILHQIGAVLSFVLIVRARFSAQYPASQRIGA